MESSNPSQNQKYLQQNDQASEQDYTEKEGVFWKKGDLFIDGFLDEELVKERINTLALRENRSKVSQAELEDLLEAQKIFDDQDMGETQCQPQIITRKSQGNNDTLTGFYTVVFDDNRDYITLEKHKLKAKKYPQAKLKQEEFEEIINQVKNISGFKQWIGKSFLSPKGAIRWRSKDFVQKGNVGKVLKCYSEMKSQRHLLLNTGTHGFDGQTVFTNPDLLKGSKFKADCMRYREQDMKIVVNRPGIKFSVKELILDDGNICTVQNPEYPDNMDTIDCWCFSYLSPMWKKDFKKFRTGEYVYLQAKDMLLKKCLISYEKAQELFKGVPLFENIGQITKFFKKRKSKELETKKRKRKESKVHPTMAQHLYKWGQQKFIRMKYGEINLEVRINLKISFIFLEFGQNVI